MNVWLYVFPFFFFMEEQLLFNCFRFCLSASSLVLSQFLLPTTCVCVWSVCRYLIIWYPMFIKHCFLNSPCFCVHVCMCAGSHVIGAQRTSSSGVPHAPCLLSRVTAWSSLSSPGDQPENLPSQGSDYFCYPGAGITNAQIWPILEFNFKWKDKSSTSQYKFSSSINPILFFIETVSGIHALSVEC